MKVHTLILPCHLTTHNRSQSSFSTLSLSHHQSKMWVANLTWFPLPLTLGWLDQLPHLGLIDGGWECQHGAEASPEHTHTHKFPDRPCTSRRTTPHLRRSLAERTYVSDCSRRGLGFGAQTESFTTHHSIMLVCRSRTWFITFKTEGGFEWHLSSSSLSLSVTNLNHKNYLLETK